MHIRVKEDMFLVCCPYTVMGGVPHYEFIRGGKKRKILSKFEAFSNELNLSPINKCKTHPLLTGTDLFNLPRGKLNKELALLESVRTTVCRCS